MKNKEYDLLVVGGGILGTFHAYYALKKGLLVALVEKNKQPQGATVRNFGQIVPSGLNQKWQNYGRETLKEYKSIQDEFDISIRKNGTIYIASDNDEVQLIEELHEINKKNEYTSELMTKEACLSKYKGLKEEYCKAGLFFPQEATVEPRVMIHRLQIYMIQELGLLYFSERTIISIEEKSKGNVLSVTSNGEVLKSKKVFLCSGSDFRMLFPEIYNESELEVSKLQMLQTKPQKMIKLDGSVLTGLTIRRYEAFGECPSYISIKTRENIEKFENKYGIHLSFKQAEDGSIIIGDSHEYANVRNIDDLGFDINMDIDNFILQQAKKIFNLPTYEIQNRWIGMYVKCKTKGVFEYDISNNIHIVTGIGGKGMTVSGGFAKENIYKKL